MACGTFDERQAFRFDLLRHAGQRVVFGKDPDDRFSRPVARHECSRHVGYAMFDVEAVLLQF